MKRACRAFTLLELLLATAISAVLMVGVLSVVTTLGAPALGQSTVVEQDAMATAMDGWVRVLGHDLQHATTFEMVENQQLTITTYASLGPARRDLIHRPVRVVYRIERINGRAWVTRRQVALDVLTNQQPQVDLVAAGVSGFRLFTDRKAVRLHVWEAGTPTPTHDRLVTLRAGGVR